MSIMVQTQLINHMKVNQLTPHSIDISKDLLLSVKGPSTRYRIYLEEETKKKGDSEAENHTAIISQACDLVQVFVELTFCALVGVHLHTYIALYGYFSLSVRTVTQQWKQLAVRFYSRWYYGRSGVRVSAGRIRLAMNRFYTKQTKIFRPKNLHIWFFLKVLKKCFVAQKVNLEDTVIYRGGWRKNGPKSIIGQMECETETWRTVNQKLILSSFICIC